MANYSSELNMVYIATMQIYEQLSVISNSSEQFKSPFATSLIETGLQNLEKLLEAENAAVATNEIQTQLNNSLIILKTQLLQIKKRQQSLLQAREVEIATPYLQAQATNKSKVPQNKFLENIQNMLVTPRSTGLNEIAGLYDVKKFLTMTMMIPLHQPQLYQGKEICNSILLYGPPGTGKSRIAHAIAAEISASLYYVTSSSLLSHFVGETERMISALFQTVKADSDRPRILFMDEIDGLCKSRQDGESDWTRRLKTQLMCELTDFENCSKVYLIAATNCPWDIDSAFVRRFQRRLYVPLPNRFDRSELLSILTKKMSIKLPARKVDLLLDKTEGYSGSDMTDLLRHALNVPLDELIENTAWEQVEDNRFRPALKNTESREILRCEFSKLPPNSAQAREVHYKDLFAALNVVKRTVSEANVQKYQLFVNK